MFSSINPFAPITPSNPISLHFRPRYQKHNSAYLIPIQQNASTSEADTATTKESVLDALNRPIMQLPACSTLSYLYPIKRLYLCSRHGNYKKIPSLMRSIDRSCNRWSTRFIAPFSARERAEREDDNGSTHQ